MSALAEIDSLEVLVIVDNEVDPLSPYDNPALSVSGRLRDVGLNSPFLVSDRGDAKREFRGKSLCCGAHGLSLMITAVKDGSRRTVLFDTGPEEDVWASNVGRLRADISPIDLIHLSHWHWDHSGGMIRAIRMIKEAKGQQGSLIVDLHPARPHWRGFMMAEPVSQESNPTFEAMEDAGATVMKNDAAHTVLNDMFLVSGEIPRVTSYETGLKNGIRFNDTTKSWEKDELILDERFLMCNLKGKGLVVFTGCSHAGAVNTAKHALTLAGNDTPLHALIGGYHLADGTPAKIQETVQDFIKLSPRLMMPGHCTGWRAKFALENAMPGRLAPSTVGTKFIF